MWSTLVLNTMVEKSHGFDPIMYAFFFDLTPRCYFALLFM